MPGSDVARVDSTKVWIGSTVITCLGLSFGSGLIVLGSLLKWRSDGVLGLYNVSGWRYHNVVSGDGKITMALGILMAIGLLAGLLAQNKYAFIVSAVGGGLVMGFSIYEIIYAATRPGITGPGHGLYMVLGGGVAGFLCSLGGYLMMAEGRGCQDIERVPGEPCEAV